MKWSIAIRNHTGTTYTHSYEVFEGTLDAARAHCRRASKRDVYGNDVVYVWVVAVAS